MEDDEYEFGAPLDTDEAAPLWFRVVLRADGSIAIHR